MARNPLGYGHNPVAQSHCESRTILTPQYRPTMAPLYGRIQFFITAAYDVLWCLNDQASSSLTWLGRPQCPVGQRFRRRFPIISLTLFVPLSPTGNNRNKIKFFRASSHRIWGSRYNLLSGSRPETPRLASGMITFGSRPKASPRALRMNNTEMLTFLNSSVQFLVSS